MARAFNLSVGAIGFHRKNLAAAQIQHNHADRVGLCLGPLWFINFQFSHIFVLYSLLFFHRHGDFNRVRNSILFCLRQGSICCDGAIAGYYFRGSLLVVLPFRRLGLWQPNSRRRSSQGYFTMEMLAVPRNRGVFPESSAARAPGKSLDGVDARFTASLEARFGIRMGRGENYGETRPYRIAIQEGRTSNYNVLSFRLRPRELQPDRHRPTVKRKPRRDLRASSKKKGRVNEDLLLLRRGLQFSVQPSYLQCRITYSLPRDLPAVLTEDLVSRSSVASFPAPAPGFGGFAPG